MGLPQDDNGGFGDALLPAPASTGKFSAGWWGVAVLDLADDDDVTGGLGDAVAADPLLSDKPSGLGVDCLDDVAGAASTAGLGVEGRDARGDLDSAIIGAGSGAGSTFGVAGLGVPLDLGVADFVLLLPHNEPNRLPPPLFSPDAAPVSEENKPEPNMEPLLSAGFSGSAAAPQGFPEASILPGDMGAITGERITFSTTVGAAGATVSAVCAGVEVECLGL